MELYVDKCGNSCLKLDYGKTLIPSNEIRYIESIGNYSLINLKDRPTQLSAFTLSLFGKELLALDNFFLSKRGLLLNLNYLTEILLKAEVLHAKLKDGEELLLSRRKGKALINYISLMGLNIKHPN